MTVGFGVGLVRTGFVGVRSVWFRYVRFGVIDRVGWRSGENRGQLGNRPAALHEPDAENATAHHDSQGSGREDEE